MGAVFIKSAQSFVKNAFIQASWGLSTLVKEFTAAAGIMQSSLN